MYVDVNEKTRKDWKASLGAEEYVGQVELQSRWPEGYGSMTVVEAGRVAK